MAKSEGAKAPETKAKIGSREWRGVKVFFCQAVPGCVFDHEVEAAVRRHVALGRHQVQGKTEPVAEVAPTEEGEA